MSITIVDNKAEEDLYSFLVTNGGAGKEKVPDMYKFPAASARILPGPLLPVPSMVLAQIRLPDPSSF